VIVVEQFVSTALGIATGAAIMLHGKIAHVGTPDEMSEAALAAYL